MKKDEIGEVAQIDFYRQLRSLIHNWAKTKGKAYEYLEYLLLAPDFFYLLVKLMFDGDVPLKAKARIGIVILYYISPVDIVPEGLLGPVGFADDLVLAVWTVRNLLRSVDRDTLLKHWPSEENLFVAMEKILNVADEWLSKGAYQKLKNFFKQKVMGA